MAPKRILFINPIHWEGDSAFLDYLNAYKEEDTTVDMVSLRRGTQHHLEYHYYEALIADEVLHQVKQGENDGYDAAVIGCFYDPFIRPAREICEKMIVTAPAEACMSLAAILGHKFSVIVGRNKWIPEMHENVVKLGLESRLASFRSLGLGVEDFHANEGVTENKMREQVRLAVEEDRAEVIILGCTMQFGFYRQLQEEFQVPVLDAMIAPLKYAEFLTDVKAKTGWYFSKIGVYESPRLSEIKAWGLEQVYGVPGLW